MSDSPKYPRLVYKCPGPYQRQGGTFDYFSVKTGEEYNQKLNEGWHDTLPKAVSAHDAEEAKKSGGRKHQEA